MKVELKNVKHAAWNSQETACFSAKVYIDGRCAGTVSNDGHGGPDDYAPWELRDRLTEWAKTLPPFKSPFSDDPEPMSAHNAETAIGDLLDAFLAAHDFKRLIAKAVVLVKTDGKIYTMNVKRWTSFEQAVAFVSAKPDVRHVLNTMPYDEAFEVYRKAAG